MTMEELCLMLPALAKQHGLDMRTTRVVVAGDDEGNRLVNPGEMSVANVAAHPGGELFLSASDPHAAKTLVIWPN